MPRGVKKKVIDGAYAKNNKTCKFTPSQQLEIARRAAWFWTNNQLIDFAKEEYGIKASYDNFSYYRNST